MDLWRGHLVRVRPLPSVDPRLWDHEGIVVATQTDHLLLELDTGADVAVLPEQVEFLRPPRGPA